MKSAKKHFIKRYANRKLYNTETSSYVTLDDLDLLIRNGVDIQIIDNKSNEDLTSHYLIQIIHEQQKKKKHLPLGLLRTIIQDGGQTIGDFIQKKVTSPVVGLREEAEKRMDYLLKKGEWTKEEISGAFKDLILNVEDFQKKVDDKINSTVSVFNTLKNLTKEVKNIGARVDKIENDMKSLKK